MPSKVIKFFNYDEEQRVLTIGFVSGSKYRYLDVPAALHRRFRSAFSKGQFFAEHIRDVYRYEKSAE